MDLKGAIKSNTFKKGLKFFSAIVLLAAVFAAGVAVGLEKARYSYSWGENYYKNFAARRPGPPVPPGIPLDRDYLNAHGSTGQIIKIEGNIITVKNNDGTEKNILASSQTTFRQGRQNISLNDLKINENIVAIGSPDSQGEINASLIRVMDPSYAPANPN
ncbi:MAG: hypothetical protein M1383_00255 [Patescibacteria group bacterium]|nr:hypothetical protein [Patescibacteria group bacterium]